MCTKLQQTAEMNASCWLPSADRANVSIQASIHQGSRFLPVKLRLLSVLGLHVFEVVGPPVVDPDECRVVHVQTRPRRGHGFQRLCVLDERGPQLETLPRLRQVVLKDKFLKLFCWTALLRIWL